MQPWSEAELATPADHAACRTLLRNGSRSFFAASLLLPASVRQPASALYAFCRLADDAVDLAGGGLPAVERMRERLERAYAGCPLPLPVDRAFADVVRRYRIPQTLPESLLEGLAWDAVGRRYEDLGQLHAYAVRVAGTVGAMMAILIGRRSPGSVARACDLGVAMQLSNIARDVGEDARAGRLYLPLAWLRDAGVDPDAWLARPAFSPAIGAAVQRLLREADLLYERAGAGIAGLPLGSRPGIYAARFLYAGIGREIERRGLNSVAGRAVVPLSRKLWLLARAVAASATAERVAPLAPLDQARFLVDAVATAPVGPVPSDVGTEPGLTLGDRAAWVLDLFERLERQEQLGRSAGRS